MTLACARLGCTERAHTVLVFEPGSAAAWMMHAVEAHRTQGILLCRVHADVVTVPMGWNLVDERDPTWEPVGASLEQAPEPEPTVAAQAVPEPPRQEADVVEIPVGSADDDDSESPAPAVAADPEAEAAAFEEVAAAQWTEDHDEDEVGTPTLFAVGDEADEADAADGEDPPVETPLLNRAFRAAHRI